MIIKEIGIRGFKSYGSNEQVVRLNPDKGELILLCGSNGNGKSIKSDSKIEIDISFLKSINLNEFLIFLDVMDWERIYILYIKENNKELYDEYIQHTNK
jgi:uncharacterized metal-binding protein